MFDICRGRRLGEADENLSSRIGDAGIALSTPILSLFISLLLEVPFYDHEIALAGCSSRNHLFNVPFKDEVCPLFYNDAQAPIWD